MFPCSRPPKLPPGQEGRGSYVWVPHTEYDKSDNASVAEQGGADDNVDDIAEEGDNGSAHTEEEYEDDYAADDTEDDNVGESAVMVDEDVENEGQIA